jgi:hypothetical protein
MLEERGVKLNMLAERMAGMQAAADGMTERLREYNAKQRSKKWYQL